jgi:molecular chaperone DnaK (HSP70)
MCIIQNKAILKNQIRTIEKLLAERHPTNLSKDQLTTRLKKLQSQLYSLNKTYAG